MGKFGFSVGSDVKDQDLEGFYSGPTPPAGNYTGVVKQFKMTKNKNDDYRLLVIVEIDEPAKSDKAKYNGFGLIGGYNVTEQGAPWINNLLDAIGAKRDDFWNEKLVCSSGTIDKTHRQDVLKIGSRKTTGHVVRAVAKVKPASGDYPEGIELSQFLLDGDDEPNTASAKAEPDDADDAAGLSDPDADDATDETDAAEGDSDGYTDEELAEMTKAELQTVCDEWGIDYAPKATEKTLRNLIKTAQETPAEEEPEADADADGSDDSDADAGSVLSDEDLAGMEKEELIEYMTEQGWEDKIPKPALASRMRKLISQLQSEPPF